MPDLKKKEVNIAISAFLQCKIIQFLLFFYSLIQICFRLNKKKCFSNFYFYFFLKKIRKPSIKKNKALKDLCWYEGYMFFGFFLLKVYF